MTGIYPPLEVDRCPCWDGAACGPTPRELAPHVRPWQPWAMSTNEQHAQGWLDAHGEDGRDHDAADN